MNRWPAFSGLTSASSGRDRPRPGDRAPGSPVRLWILLSLLLLLRGSQAWAGVPEPQATEPPIGESKEVRKLYNAKCAKCHQFYSPAAYSAADWKVWMDKMARKSKLQPTQTELLRRYTAFLRETGPPPSDAKRKAGGQNK